MSHASEGGRRDAFLWKVLEQFEGLSRGIAKSFRAEAWENGEAAVLSISQEGREDEVIRVAARFDDAGAERDGFDALLRLTVEWQGDVTEMLKLGWRGSQPVIDRGLDSLADHCEGEYRMGKAVRALRDDIRATLNLRMAPDAHSAIVEMPEESGGEKQLSIDRQKTAADRAWKPAARRAEQRPPSSRPDVSILQVSLGELAALGGLRAERVFAGFIQATASRNPLAQGDVIAFLQGALVELYLYQEACLYGPRWMRPKTVKAEGGALRDAVLAAKAVLFEGNDEARRQVAREMLAAMRTYYNETLGSRGAAEDEIAAKVKSAFGNAATIANEAVKGLSGSLSVSGRRGKRQSLLPGNGL
jgi:hypothetical protein